MMNRRVVIILGAVLLAAVIVVALISLIAGSRRESVSDNTLSIWSPFDEATVYDEIARPFLENNPGVQLKFRYVEAGNAKEYEAKVVDAIAAGTGPDIWLIRNDWLPKHLTKLASSSGYVNWSKDQRRNEQAALEQYFSKQIFAQNSSGGKLYGYPLGVDSLALYINPGVVSSVRRELDEQGNAEAAEKLRRAPTTWSELQEWVRLLTAKDLKGNISRSGLALGTVANTYAPVDVYTALLFQYGGNYFESANAVGLHLIRSKDGQRIAAGNEALRLQSSFGRPGEANYSWNATLGDPVRAFVEGKTAMMLGYSALTRQLRLIDKNFEPTVAPLPQRLDPALVTPVASAAYWVHVVSKTSTKPQLAWDFLQSLGGEAAKIYRSKTGKPTLDQALDVQNWPNTATGEETDLFAQQVVFAPAVYKPDWQAVDETIQDMLNQAIQPGQSIQALVDSAAERLKALISTGS